MSKLRSHISARREGEENGLKPRCSAKGEPDTQEQMSKVDPYVDILEYPPGNLVGKPCGVRVAKSL